MNKFTFALALGAGLVLSLAATNAQADPMVQTLTPATMSSVTFNNLYAPDTTVLTQPYSFMNTPNAGMVESQVFTGTGAATGTYAYAYQFDVNNTTDTSTAQATSVNSASMLFNATPLATYVVTNGSVGGINPAQAAVPGSQIQTPTSIAWLPNSTTGSLTFQYLNPTANTAPLQAGAMSGTIVVISKQSPGASQYVSLQNPEPQTTYPLAYAPSNGTIAESPAPEPATLLAWGSVLAALVVGHRWRRNHNVA
jgi:hypothetical protein